MNPEPYTWQDFSRLIHSLEGASSGQERQAILNHHFVRMSPRDVYSCLGLMHGWKPGWRLSMTDLVARLASRTPFPQWLVSESHRISQDWIETYALMDGARQDTLSFEEVIDWLRKKNKNKEFPWRDFDRYWCRSQGEGRVLLTRLATGHWRPAIDHADLFEALVNYLAPNCTRHEVALLGIEAWDNDEADVESRISTLKQKYPHLEIGLIYPSASWMSVDEPPVERHWSVTLPEGLDAFLVIRENRGHLFREDGRIISLPARWSSLLRFEADVEVKLQGVLTFLKEGQFLPFEETEKWVRRKSVPKNSGIQPVFIVHDLLSQDREDVRLQPLSSRVRRLEDSCQTLDSEFILFPQWKKEDNVTPAGRQQVIFKPPTEPYLPEVAGWKRLHSSRKEFKATVLYVERSGGWGQQFFDRMTVAVRRGEQLIPVGKVVNTLDADDNKRLNEFVKTNRLERFGPVTTIKATLVFVISFEAVVLSSRTKSGIKLRHARIESWDVDGDVALIDTLASLLDQIDA